MTKLDFLYSGLALGLSQGFSPGPHSALVVTETLRHSLKGGIKVAVAPIAATIPILLVCWPVAALAAQTETALGIISLLGALFLFVMAWENLAAKNVLPHATPTPGAASFSRGALAALLSPHPYLFWITVGTPLLIRGWSLTPAAPCIFLLSFLLLFVIAKVALALLVIKLRDEANQMILRSLIRLMGIVMFGFGVSVGLDGFKLMGVI